MGEYHINTARYAARLPENAQADGHWFWEARGADENEGGQSSIIWPVELGSDADSLSTVIDLCQGICGVASLKKRVDDYAALCRCWLCDGQGCGR